MSSPTPSPNIFHLLSSNSHFIPRRAYPQSSPNKVRARLYNGWTEVEGFKELRNINAPSCILTTKPSSYWSSSILTFDPNEQILVGVTFKRFQKTWIGLQAFSLGKEASSVTGVTRLPKPHENKLLVACYNFVYYVGNVSSPVKIFGSDSQEDEDLIHLSERCGSNVFHTSKWNIFFVQRFPFNLIRINTRILLAQTGENSPSCIDLTIPKIHSICIPTESSAFLFALETNSTLLKQYNIKTMEIIKEVDAAATKEKDFSKESEFAIINVAGCKDLVVVAGKVGPLKSGFGRQLLSLYRAKNLQLLDTVFVEGNLGVTPEYCRHLIMASTSRATSILCTFTIYFSCLLTVFNNKLHVVFRNRGFTPGHKIITINGMQCIGDEGSKSKAVLMLGMKIKEGSYYEYESHVGILRL